MSFNLKLNNMNYKLSLPAVFFFCCLFACKKKDSPATLPDNAPPVATGLSVSGTIEVGKIVTAEYTYSDAENNPEGGTTFQWYTATSTAGTDEAPITGATEKIYTIPDGQKGKFLRVAVTPKSTAGTTTGVEVKSAYTTAVGEEIIITYPPEGSVTYGVIISPVTQRKWLDRNLGATRVAQAINDYQAYGDLFQWGRPADGHHRINRTGLTDADASGVTGITSTVAPYVTSPNDVPATDKFIVEGINGDWRATPNNNLWQGVYGINNPCPTGWRLPTKAEWIAEAFTTGTEAFSRLKLTYTGKRSSSTGNFSLTTTSGFYWTSTPQETPDEEGLIVSAFITFEETTFSTSGFDRRLAGQAVRCIKD
jgi:hypothetical protein